jgi:hypothetical protein
MLQVLSMLFAGAELSVPPNAGVGKNAFPTVDPAAMIGSA